MPAIFISYRRDDTLSATGRLNHTLEARFGTEAIFRDLDEIEAGADFRLTLLEVARSARVMLVVIGRFWSTLTSGDGTPRLYDPNDYVRLEIETALAHSVSIIPVLVEGARMPRSEELPESIRALTSRHAHEISESRWGYDTQQLIESLERNAGLVPIAVWTGGRLGIGGILGALTSILARLPWDFLSLLYQPRQFLAERSRGAHRDVPRALAFLVVAQLAGAVLILQEWPTRSSVPSFLFTAVVVGLLSVLALSMPLYLAWRLTGAPGEYRRILVILLYQASLVALAYSVAVLITLTGVNMARPILISEFAENPTLDGLRVLTTGLESAPPVWAAASMMSGLIAVALAIWFVATWGAYRRALGQSRMRSLAALVLFVSFCFTPFVFLLAVASL